MDTGDDVRPIDRSPDARSAAQRLFAGPGEVRARCRALDWAATPLGPVDRWPASLRTAIGICLDAAVPSVVWWGPELVQLHNDAALGIIGPKHAAALGAPARVTWADVWPVVGHLLEGALATGEAVRRDDLPMVLERGGAQETAWFTFSYGPVRDERGAVAGVFCTALETTERKRAEEALLASEARFRALAESIRDHAIFLVDASGTVIEWTTGAERTFGYSAGDAVGRHLSSFLTPVDVARGEPARELHEAARTGRAEREGWRVRNDGTRFWAEEIATAVYDAAGGVVGFTKIVRDVTERRLVRQADERARTEAGRVELQRRLTEAEEAERRRLARELHDQLGQHLAALTLGLDHAKRVAGADSPAAPRLAQLEELARAMTRDARYLALELRPPELDDIGLESALETYVDQWTRRYGIRVDVAITGLRERSLPDDVATALYRILQEALTNVARHAEASHVSVIVEKPAGEVRLIIEDDGRGFDVDSAAERARVEGRLGLAGMRERAALVAGTLAVESSPGAGTTLYVRIPIPRARLSLRDATGRGEAAS